MSCTNPQARGLAGQALCLVRPCGQCISCRLNYSRSKAIRAVHELEFWDRSSFVTLTYDDDSLIYHPGFLQPTLSRRDLQLFFKNLRRRIEPRKISYMASGEYGENTHRPHYHAILYGIDFSDDREYWKTLNGNKLYTSKLLTGAWGNKGHAVIGDVTFDSASYVASYTVKKLSGEHSFTFYEDQGRDRPFGAMSTSPAIGKRWIEKNWRDVYPRDTIISRGHEVRPPRYYDEYLKSQDEALYKQVMAQRVLDAENRLSKNLVADPTNRSMVLSSRNSFNINEL